jgi:transposase-like protein
VARWCNPLQVVAGACFEATKTHVVRFSLERIPKPMAIPDICGNGHLLTHDNLKVDYTKRRWRCRSCGRVRSAEFRARHKPAAWILVHER